MKKNHIPLRFFAPKFWGAWVGLFFIRMFSFIPYSWMKKISSILGKLFFKLVKTRRRIIETNINLCFPDKTAEEKKELARQAFISAIMAVFETSLSWWGAKSKISQLHTVEGMEYLEAASKKGKGVILLVSHFTTMEIAGVFLNSHIDNLNVVYKPSNNELLEYFIEHKRLERCSGLLKHKNLRGIVRSIKEGNVVWYAPDQDFATKDSTFAPFMGVMTSTLLSTQRLAKLTGAPVVPFYVARNKDEDKYTMHFSPELENFTSENEVNGATMVNHAIEEQVKNTPEQYLWAHRRFKTRPPGEKDIYPLKLSIFRYKLLLFIAFIPLLIFTLWQSIRALDFRYFTQRLALYFSGAVRENGIWIHAASVGEVNAAIPLLLKIHSEHPELQLTVTTNTITGANVFEQHLPNVVQHFFFPLDYRWAVRHIIKKIKPKAVFIIETELWPNLYIELYKNKIPLAIINGRISEKTLHAKKWVKKIYAQILHLVSHVYMRSETDQERFIKIGLPHNKSEVLGNIKYSALTSQNIEAINLSRPYVLAASTRDDEEKIIVDAWLKAQYGDHLLVIVPRHIQRLPEILKQLKSFNLNIAVRSKNELLTPETDIYIADTMGELKQFIAGSEFVIMGGSFVEKGGHNILEVAQLGKAVVFGPDMRSFEDEAELFLHYEAGIQCTNNLLDSVFTQLMSDNNYRINIEENAKILIKANNNILNNYYKRIKNYV